MVGRPQSRRKARCPEQVSRDSDLCTRATGQASGSGWSRQVSGPRCGKVWSAGPLGGAGTARAQDHEGHEAVGIGAGWGGGPRQHAGMCQCGLLRGSVTKSLGAGDRHECHPTKPLTVLLARGTFTASGEKCPLRRPAHLKLTRSHQHYRTCHS